MVHYARHFHLRGAHIVTRQFGRDQISFQGHQVFMQLTLILFKVRHPALPGPLMRLDKVSQPPGRWTFQNVCIVAHFHWATSRTSFLSVRSTMPGRLPFVNSDSWGSFASQFQRCTHAT